MSICVRLLASSEVKEVFWAAGLYSQQRRLTSISDLSTILQSLVWHLSK